MKQTEMNDPWSDGLQKSTKSAQKAFDRRKGDFSDAAKERAAQYHANCATSADRERISMIEGNENEIIAWYWEDSIRA
jgi:hypothetical protein